MIDVDKIQDIRVMWRRGCSVAEISRSTGVSEPTIRKYRDRKDLSPEPPKARKETSELLSPYTPIIDGWLEEDKKYWYKQRHTAKRVFDRLRDEHAYPGSYSTVRRYVKKRREEMLAEANQRDRQGYLQLDWLPGECQVDFGQADFRVRGVTTRGHYLTVDFPHSNVGITQVFWGETAECICEGLQNVFVFVGGVPRRAVFDNATEVGRKLSGAIHTSEMFRLFCAHFGLDFTFTNPYSGHEKGAVEAKVGYHRRNLFVPLPAFHDVEAFNRRLLEDCLDMSDKRHYRLNTPEIELFEEDRRALLALPAARFACVKWEVRKCNKQGIVTVGGIHRYSAGPAFANRTVNVALGAFTVTILDPDTGELVAGYEREWGDTPTDSTDPILQLKLLCLRPMAWRDSVVRKSLPQELVDYLDVQPAADLGRDLRILRDEAHLVGWAAAIEGMLRSLDATGGLDAATVSLAAARAASGDQRVDYDEAVDLSSYDCAFRLLEGGDGDAA